MIEEVNMNKLLLMKAARRKSDNLEAVVVNHLSSIVNVQVKYRENNRNKKKRSLGLAHREIRLLIRFPFLFSKVKIVKVLIIKLNK